MHLSSSSPMLSRGAAELSTASLGFSPKAPATFHGTGVDLTASFDNPKFTPMSASGVLSNGQAIASQTPFASSPLFQSPTSPKRASSASGLRPAFQSSPGSQFPQLSPSGTTGASMAPFMTNTVLDTYNVAQLLEKELASERAERREEVSFITKMHEKEIDVWKSRSQGAAQRLEGERKVFEKEVGSLDSKLAVALERSRWYEERVQRLEDELVQRNAALEERGAAARHAETVAAEVARARDAEHNASRELVQQENDRLSTLIRQLEHEAQETAKQNQKQELSAQRGNESLGQALKSMEGTTLVLQQQESRALENVRLQESQALAQAREQAEEQVAAQRSQVCLYESLHKEALQTRSELQLQAEASGRQAAEAHDVERQMLEMRVTELRASIAELGEKHSAAMDLARREHQAEVTRLQSRASEFAEERLLAQSSVENLRSLHELAEQSCERQLQESAKRLDMMRDDKRDFDAQREHALQQETEAATLRRMELAWLRTELEELKSQSSKDLDNIVQQKTREVEHREACDAAAAAESRKHSAQYLEFESRLAEAELERVRLRASLTMVEKEEARSVAMLECLRPELAACEARSAHAEVRWSERSHEAFASQEQLRNELRIEVLEIEQSKALAEASSHRARSELEESEAGRLQLTQALTQLRAESRHLLCSYHQQQQRATQLDGTMRQHLALLEREASDLLGLKEVLASADLSGVNNASMSEPLDTILLHSLLANSPV